MGTCHGGGIRHATIADRILELEYVDSEARLQTVRDKEALSVAAGDPTHSDNLLIIIASKSSIRRFIITVESGYYRFHI